MGELVTVSVVATDPLLEAGVSSALYRSPDVEVVPPAEPAEVTVLVVDDVGGEVFDQVRAAQTVAHRPEVVLVAPELTPADALRAIAAGARGLLWRREANADRVAHTVLAAAAGDCTVPPGLLDRLLGNGPTPVSLSAPRPAQAPANWLGNGMSERERAVLRLVAEGHETGEIAKQLCYSTRTVTSVVHGITQRFRLHNRAHAVAYALRAGIL